MKQRRQSARSRPAWLKAAAAWLVGLITSAALIFISFEYGRNRERNSFTVQEVHQISPLQIGIGRFWFDDGSAAFASLTSFLRTDGVEVIELPGMPDRKIASGLHYKGPDDLFLYESVPLPNHRSCFPKPLEAIEERELQTWQELVIAQTVDVLILGEVTSDPKTLRLWIGGMDGPHSLFLPFSTRGEITEATDPVKVAILTTLPRLMEHKLELSPNLDARNQEVVAAIQSLTHALKWRGIDKSSRLAIEVTRARLQASLLTQGKDVPDQKIEDGYWALRQSNRIAAPCGSVSVMYDQDEAIHAVALTRSTGSDAWDRRASAAFERVKEKAEKGGSCGAAEMSEQNINRLIVERGLRQKDTRLIEEGLRNLEKQYDILPFCDSPVLKIKLPDVMIVLYRQAAKETLNEEYSQRAEELWERHKKDFPKGLFERSL